MEKQYKILPYTLNSEENEKRVKNPEVHSKYKHVWQSARIKLKFRHILNTLFKAALIDNEEKNELHRQNARVGNYSSETISQNLRLSLIISPNSRCLSYWNTFILLTLVYTTILMPVFLAFPPSDQHDVVDVFDRILSGIYFIDFLINCSTGIKKNSGLIVITRKEILISYFKSWMIVDIVAFFPFEVFFNSARSINPLFKIFRITRMYKVLKITKIVKWIKVKKNYGMMIKLQDIFGIKHSVLQMIVTFISILLCIHIISCIWCFSARLDDYSPNTWVSRSGNIDEDSFSLYLSSFYWSLTTLTTVGYGDISAGTNLERIISIFWMICSLNFLGFTISTLSSFLNGIDTHDKILLNKLAIIDEFCHEAGLSKLLKLKLRNALRHSSSISRYSLLQQFDILNELPKDLKYEIALAMHRGAARTFKFFNSKDDYLIVAIVPYLTPNFVNIDNYVYKSYDFPDEIYFLVKGRVVYINPKNGTGIYTIMKKDYFGDIEVLMKIPRKFSAISRENCEMLCLSYQIVSKIKKDYPNIYFEIRGVAVERDRVLQSTLKNIKDLRRMERHKSVSEMTVLKFQAFHKIRRDMKKSENFKRVAKRSLISQSKISNQIELICDKLESLQNNVLSAKQLINK